MLRGIIIGIVAVGLVVSSALAEGYSAIEVYPSGNIFIYAGRPLCSRGEVNVWSNVSSEVAATVGPTIGPLAIGIGASIIGTDKGLEVGYLNLNLGFGIDLGPVHLQSYNLYQVGRGSVENFILSRHWLSHKEFPVGIVGHNIKIGNNPVLPFWGVYAQLGKMGSFSSRLCLAVNVRDHKSLWAAWNIGL